MALDWNKKQLDTLAKMDIPFDVAQELTDDQLEQLYEIVPDHLEFDKNAEPTDQGAIVEDILTLVGAEMGKRGLLA